MKHKLEHFWVMIGICWGQQRDGHFPLIPPSILPSIHPYLQGPLRKQKTDRIVVLRGGSPPFYLKGRHKPYYLSVTATNYCWLPGSASTSNMHEWTDTSLSLFLQGPPLAPSVFYLFFIYLLYSADIKVPNMTCSFESKLHPGLKVRG